MEIVHKCRRTAGVMTSVGPKFGLKIANLRRWRLSNQTEYRRALNRDSLIWKRFIRRPNYKSEATIRVHLRNFEINILDVLGTACNAVQLHYAVSCGDRGGDHFRGRMYRSRGHNMMPDWQRKNTTKYSIKLAQLILKRCLTSENFLAPFLMY